MLRALTLAALVISANGPVSAEPVRDDASRVVVDSRMTLAQALGGTNAPERVRKSLAIVDVRYRGFDARAHAGQIVVRKDLAREVQSIFRNLERLRFPIARVVSVARYGWSDNASMAANNTSGFNYRRKPGERGMSRHAFGTAIDLNPRQNPYVLGKVVLPPGARHRAGVRGTIVDGPVVRAFTRRGWQWGGHFRRHKDWQRFYKPN